jgi:hypothetical protein
MDRCDVDAKVRAFLEVRAGLIAWRAFAQGAMDVAEWTMPRSLGEFRHCAKVEACALAEDP